MNVSNSASSTIAQDLSKDLAPAARTTPATPASSSPSSTPATGAVRLHAEHDEANEVEGDHDRDEGHEVHTHVSEHGRDAARLSALAGANPAWFSELTGGVAERLRSAAGQAGGEQGSLLQAMADQFAKASQTGQVAPLGIGAGGGFKGHAHVRKYAEQQASKPGATQVQDLILELLGKAAAAA